MFNILKTSYTQTYKYNEKYTHPWVLQFLYEKILILILIYACAYKYNYNTSSRYNSRLLYEPKRLTMQGIENSKSKKHAYKPQPLSLFSPILFLP